MLRIFSFVGGGMVAFAALLLLVGCSASSPTASPDPAEKHDHGPGAANASSAGKVADEGERKLYLTPGGLYTQADIEANGSLTVSQKFAKFQAAHDLNPKVGDKICPVTLTKANPKCSWIVGGKSYEFCCPPCVDEFVKLAKSNPEKVKQPDQYVKREAAAGLGLK